MKKSKLIMFLLFSTIIPIAYLIVRFKLYKAQTVNVISLWAIIVIALLLTVISIFIKYYLDGMKTKFSMLKQIMMGVIKIILPLIFVLVVFIFLKSRLDWFASNINLIIEALIFITACELVAIIVNPLPQWAFDNNVAGLEEILDKIKEKK